MPLPPRIAIVEGDDLIRQLLTRWLEQAGYAVDHTLAHQLPRHRVDLVIAEVHGADAAAQRVAALREGSGAALLLISARFPRGASRSRTLAASLGVQGVLPVPFTEAELLAAVRRIVNGAG